MNAIGIALIWCIVQITLLGVLVAGLYLLVRRVRPAAAASVVLSSLAIVVVLSVLALSPWPRWTVDRTVASSALSSEDVSDAKSSSAARPAVVRSAPSEEPFTRASSSPQSRELSPDAQRSSSPFLPKELPGTSAQPPANQQAAGAAEAADADSDAATARPSSASLLWQSLMAELSYPQTAAPDDTRRWPAVVAVVLLLAMTCGVGWLVLGMVAVRRQRARSRPILDRELLELIDVLRAELACLRSVDVRESPELSTAATIGWRRPVVLLPADWQSWTFAQRRAVLAHELFHARSHDFLALLFGQFGLMLHCYHPLLHWLMDRLRLEQELAADAAAASVSGGPRQYLSTIAELALRTEDRRLSWPTRTFLPTRTTFLRRIAVLRDSRVSFDRISPLLRLSMVGAVLLFGVLVAGLRGPAQVSQAAAADPPPPSSPAVATDAPATVKPNVATLPPTAAKPVAAKEPPTAVKPVSAVQPSQDFARLRYGYQQGGSHYFNVKIAATLPNEDVTHEGALVYNVLSSSDEQFTLRCIGMLHVISRPKADLSRGPMMGPRIPAPPGMFGPSRFPRGPRIPFGPGAEPIRPQETTFDRQGKIVRHGESPSLPFLLGKQVELVVEQLPAELKPAWSTERELGVIEHDESSGPYFGPFSAGSETSRGAKERVDFAVIGQDQDSIRIGKKYSLKTAPEQGITHIDMSGDGELLFDKKLGIVKSEKMKYEIRVNERNVAVTIPLVLDCRLMTAPETADQKKKEAEAKKKHEEWLAKIKAEQAAKAKGEKPAAPALHARTWRAAVGSFTVRATFVELKDDQVTLKRADGRTIKVPLEKLSKIDQTYVKLHAESAKDNAENPFE